MLFTSVLLSLGLALTTAVAANPNTVLFINQDSVQRTIVFINQFDQAPIKSIKISGHKTVNQTFPTGWIGNWYAVPKGKDVNKPGMLGEVRFDGFAGQTYFDVSAIVNPTDADGVKELFPLASNKPVSGCQTFPCSNAYNQPDDIATLSTEENTLVCLLGTSKKSNKVGREYIEN